MVLDCMDSCKRSCEKKMAKKNQNRYSRIIEEIFLSLYEDGDQTVGFAREDLEQAAQKLQIKLPKNLGDIIYSFRYRAPFPETIQAKAPKGKEWVIRPAGKGLYKFEVVRHATLRPNLQLVETKILDSTPGVIEVYALNDEQALLAKVRYNRLIDIFTGLACYSLQNHLRTSVPDLGQIETDEIYVGVNKQGEQFVLPVQAKGEADLLNIVQIEQDFALCRHRFPALGCRPIGAQFIDDDLIALFELEEQDGDIRIVSEIHYRLVPPEDFCDEDH